MYILVCSNFDGSGVYEIVCLHEVDLKTDHSLEYWVRKYRTLMKVDVWKCTDIQGIYKVVRVDGV